MELTLLASFLLLEVKLVYSYLGNGTFYVGNRLPEILNLSAWKDQMTLTKTWESRKHKRDSTSELTRRVLE